MKVFIVDDSPVVCDTLEKMFADIENIEIIGRADNASDASSAIGELKPDIVILDIRLKKGTGIDVLKKIKKAKGDPPAVIVLTNYPYPQYHDRCRAYGADYFLDKVGEIEVVPDLVRKIARGNGSRK
ncbi:MAG: response regulator transcription factor [Deltaproteobacteria bacterium]|nr:response regulator transcription factor [Deltaproteobacteria bacterium]